MYSTFRLAAKFIRYYITASNGKGHGIHSPFVFDFITSVLNDKRPFNAYSAIEHLREQLLADGRMLEVEDFGAGSITGNKKQRSVAGIAKNAAKSKKLGQLLFRIANHYQPAAITELGTSLGLSAAYLATGNPSARLVTCEGAAAIAAVANENFARLGIDNIEIAVGNFDETLPAVLQKLTKTDLAFVDGNHRKIPTLQYFEQFLEHMNRPGILIFDDIHWSQEMEAAWLEIKNHPDSMLTIDLFFIGLVFFRPDFKIKQHFVIRF
ncbi:MAG: class I SAM-dependent methyltransferase [Chitinophagaceae bacterium]